MRRAAGRSTAARPVLRIVLVLGLILGALVVARASSSGLGLVTGGPVSGPEFTVPGGLGSDIFQPEPQVTEREQPEIAETMSPEAREAAFRIVDVILVLSALLFVLGLAALISRMPDGGPEPEDWVDPVGVKDPLVLRERLVQGITLSSDLKGSGSARNAIVRAWALLEEIGTDVGVPRSPAETTTEYVPRLLALAGAPPEPVETLAALYQEARFSRHSLGGDAIAVARQSLDDIAAGLRIRVEGLR